MSRVQDLVPGYHDLLVAEESHWWHRGMLLLSAALLGERLRRRGQRILDAGCGTGAFLQWALGTGAFAEAAGIDAAPRAIALARRRLPGVRLRVAVLPEVPLPDSHFHVIACNDVLQHLPEGDVRPTLHELRRVLAPDGVLLVRTSGALSVRGTRAPWGAYTRASLARELTAVSLTCERVTHASLLPSLAAELRGRGPGRLAARRSHGIPAPSSRAKAAIGTALLRAEAGVLSRTGASLPYGHTVLALATRGSITGR
jgi:SAM-dependent methyltransferase